jgi:hypothetical protein
MCHYGSTRTVTSNDRLVHDTTEYSYACIHTCISLLYFRDIRCHHVDDADGRNAAAYYDSSGVPFTRILSVCYHADRVASSSVSPSFLFPRRPCASSSPCVCLRAACQVLPCPLQFLLQNHLHAALRALRLFAGALNFP